MDTWSGTRDNLEAALIDLEFSAVNEFGIFVTYQRQGDLVKVLAAPDGMFATFDADDEVLGEGTGAEDLRRILTEAAFSSARNTPPRRSFLDRRTRSKGSSSRPSTSAHSSDDHGKRLRSRYLRMRSGTRADFKRSVSRSSITGATDYRGPPRGPHRVDCDRHDRQPSGPV